jgi:hypothetical protein
MRVLCVIVPSSPLSVQHLNVLVGLHFDVHAATLTRHSRLPGYHPTITFHDFYPPELPINTQSSRRDAAWQRLELALTRAVNPKHVKNMNAQRWQAKLPVAPRPIPQKTESAAYQATMDRLATGLFDPGSASWLASLIDTLQPTLVHSFTLEQPSVTALLAKQLSEQSFPPWLVSSWGMDIQFTGLLPEWREAMEMVLAACDYYTAECQRDVESARGLGFAGSVLDVLPIGGGFCLDSLLPLREPGRTSQRRVIIVNGSQGAIDRGLVAIRAVHLAAPALQDYEIAIYAVGDDATQAAELLAVETGLRVTIVPDLPYEQRMRYHGRSRVGVALNLADGIGAPALESMVMGAFPIQSHTSCLNEWIEDGQTGLLVHPEDPDDVAAALRKAVTDDELVDNAVRANDKLLEVQLDETTLSLKIRRMYNRIQVDERMLH